MNLMNQVWNALVSSGVDVGGLLGGGRGAVDDGALAPVEQTVEDLGRGGLTIASSILVYAAAIGLIIGAIRIIIAANNPNKVGEAKNAFIWRIVAAILGFAAVALIIFASRVGTNLV